MSRVCDVTSLSKLFEQQKETSTEAFSISYGSQHLRPEILSFSNRVKMSHVINSGVVEAPVSSDPSHSTSPTYAAPSQASQEGNTPYASKAINHDGTGGAVTQKQQLVGDSTDPADHRLNSHAYETGIAHSNGGRVPFEPVSQTRHGAGSQVGRAPALPPRDEAQHRPLGPREAECTGPAPVVDSAETHAATTGLGSVGTNEAHTGTTAPATGSDNRSTGNKVKETASGVKGLVAAVHGAGETLRGTFNREVDRAFHDVCVPTSSSSSSSLPPSSSSSELVFPHLGVLGDWDMEKGRILGSVDE